MFVTSLETLLSAAVEDKDKFFKIIGDTLTPKEREYVKTFIKKKSCYNCVNGTCRIEWYEKPVDNCIGWENNRIVGEYRILKLNK